MKNTFKVLTLLTLALVLSFVSYALPSAVTVGDTAPEVSFEEPTVSQKIVLFEGEGTQTNPYLISSASEYNFYANEINTTGSTYADKYYQLTSNIDFAEMAIVPFGKNSTIPFKGHLDGNGYALLNVPVSDVQCSGIVGYMTQGSVKNLRVSYADMTQHKNFSELKYFGGIAGYILVASGKTVEFENCYVEGNLMLHTAGAAYAGGMFGYFKCELGNGNVNNCVADVDFDVVSDKSHYVAGMVAYTYSGSGKDCVFSNCVSYGSINAITTYIESHVSGFVAYTNKDEGGWSGWAEDETASLMAETVYQFVNCAAYGSAHGESKNKAYIGGFICFVDGGGSVKVSNCYRNSSADISGVSSAVTKNTLASATAKSNFEKQEFYESVLGMDFENIAYMSGDKVAFRSVAKSYGASVLLNKKDVRLTQKPGIRFRSEIETFKQDYALEYGVIVTRKTLLGDEELTLDFDGKKIVGVAYSTETGEDKFLERDDETIVFSAVVYNIKEENYGEEFVVRTYVKYIFEEETVVVYGNTVSSSLNSSALEVRKSDTYEYLTDSQKALLETMLPTA